MRSRRSGGYEVAWQNSGANLFSIWNTDSSGNFISYSVLSGTSTALESMETSFHQDLNGDGVIGIPTPVTIEAFGSTSLVQVGNHYFLDNISSGTGPELKYGGAPVVAGQFGSYTPIGAEQTSSGYEVAWQIPGDRSVFDLDYRQQRQLQLLYRPCQEPARRWNRWKPASIRI